VQEAVPDGDTGSGEQEEESERETQAQDGGGRGPTRMPLWSGFVVKMPASVVICGTRCFAILFNFKPFDLP
jgi:hypothetical protein